MIFSCADDSEFDNWYVTLEDWCQLANYAAENEWTLEPTGKMYDENGVLRYDPDDNFEEGHASDYSEDENNLQRIDTGNIDNMVSEMSSGSVTESKTLDAPRDGHDTSGDESPSPPPEHSGRLTQDSHGRELFQPEYDTGSEAETQGSQPHEQPQSQRSTAQTSTADTPQESGESRVSDDTQKKPPPPPPVAPLERSAETDSDDEEDDEDELFPTTSRPPTHPVAQSSGDVGAGHQFSNQFSMFRDTKRRSSQEGDAGIRPVLQGMSTDMQNPHPRDLPPPKSTDLREYRKAGPPGWNFTSTADVSPRPPHRGPGIENYSNRSKQLFRTGEDSVSRHKPLLRLAGSESPSSTAFSRVDTATTAVTGADAARAAARAIQDKVSTSSTHQMPSASPESHATWRLGQSGPGLEQRPVPNTSASPSSLGSTWLPGLNEVLNVWDEMTSDMQGMLPVFRLQDLFRRLRLDVISPFKLQNLTVKLDPRHEGLISRGNFLEWWQREASAFFYGEADALSSKSVPPFADYSLSNHQSGPSQARVAPLQYNGYAVQQPPSYGATLPPSDNQFPPAYANSSQGLEYRPPPPISHMSGDNIYGGDTFHTHGNGYSVRAGQQQSQTGSGLQYASPYTPYPDQGNEYRPSSALMHSGISPVEQNDNLQTRYHNPTLQGLAEHIQSSVSTQGPYYPGQQFNSPPQSMDDDVRTPSNVGDTWHGHGSSGDLRSGYQDNSGKPLFQAFEPLNGLSGGAPSDTETESLYSTEGPSVTTWSGGNEDIESRESVLDAFIHGKSSSKRVGIDNYDNRVHNSVRKPVETSTSLQHHLSMSLVARMPELSCFPVSRYQFRSIDIVSPHMSSAVGADLLHIDRKNAFSGAALGATLEPESTGACITGHCGSTELHWLPPGMKAVGDKPYIPGVSAGEQALVSRLDPSVDTETSPSPWIDHGQINFGLGFHFTQALKTCECEASGLDPEHQAQFIHQELNSGRTPREIQSLHGHSAIQAASGNDREAVIEDLTASRAGKYLLLPPDLRHITDTVWTHCISQRDWNKWYQRIAEAREFTFSEAVEKAVCWAAYTGCFASKARRIAAQIVHEMHVPRKERRIQELEDKVDTFHHDGITLKLVDSLSRHDSEKGGIIRRVVCHELNHNRLIYSTSLKSRRDALGRQRGSSNLSRENRFLPLSSPLSTVIDVYGFRFFATAWIPKYMDQLEGVAAIRPGDPRTADLVYGKSGPKEEFVNRDDVVHSALRRAGKELNLQQHSIETHIENEDAPVAGNVPVPVNGDIQVYRGEDSRSYVFNTARLMPSDNPEPHKRDCHGFLLRPELVVSWKKRVSSDAYRGTGQDGRPMEKALSRTREHKVMPFSVGDVPDCETNDAEAGALSHYRDTVLIPVVAKSLDDLRFIPSHSGELRSLLHSFGLNARNIGRIAQHVTTTHARTLLEVEMIARSGKHILNNNMRKLISGQSGKADTIRGQMLERQLMSIARDFFNLLLGEGEDSRTFWKQLMVPSVKNKFGYSLESQSYPKYQLFHSLQYHTGVCFIDTDFTAVPGVRDDSSSDYSFMNTHQDRAETFANTKPAQSFDTAEPLNLQEMLPWRGKAKTYVPPRCPESLFLTYSAEEYAAAGMYDSAIHAYNTRLAIIQALQACSEGERSRSRDSAFGTYAGSPESFDAASILLEIARMYLALEQYDRALEATHSGLKYSPARHPVAAKLLMVRAQCFAFRSRTEDAKALYNAAVAAVATTLGSQHPLVAAFAACMGCTLVSTGDELAGFDRIQKALEVYELTVGPYHPCVATLYEQLGRLHLWNGKTEESLVALERAYVLRENVIQRNAFHSGRKKPLGMETLTKTLRKVVNKCSGRDISVVTGAQTPNWISVVNSSVYRRCQWARTCLLLAMCHSVKVQKQLSTSMDLADVDTRTRLRNECEEITAMSKQCSSTFNSVLQNHPELQDSEDPAKSSTSDFNQIKRQILRLCDCHLSSGLIAQNKPREALSHIELLFADAKQRRRSGKRPPTDEFLRKLVAQLVSCVFYSMSETDRREITAMVVPKIPYVSAHSGITRYVLRQLWHASSPVEYIRSTLGAAISGNVRIYGDSGTGETSPVSQGTSMLLLSTVA
eukprot:gb/GECG01010563.1/.p1 GENE.gb/GECG01010563.1/~~gb/GECG01010563.1/.p1  ORF type:complete len:2107 (+),score=242.22 gb/GECG01010563.1/:1-6321(+)